MPKKFLIGSLAAIFAVGLYFAAGQITNPPNYDATYDAVNAPQGSHGSGSKTIAVISASIRDELDRGWCPSQSFLTPSSIRTDTCAYQHGLEAIFSRITYTFKEEIASQGSLSKIDSDLNEAVQDIQAGPDRWTPFLGTDSKYQAALTHLDAYNNRLANGDAEFSARIDNLNDVMKTLIHATGSQIEKLRSVDTGGGFLVGQSRADFVATKGNFRETCEILKAMKQDFGDVISKQSADESFNAATQSVCAVTKENTPLFTFFLKASWKSLIGVGAEAVAKLQNTTNALAAASQTPRMH